MKDQTILWNNGCEIVYEETTVQIDMVVDDLWMKDKRKTA
jgi:hypothetical protein